MANVTVTKNDCIIDSLYQWDLNQELVIVGLSLSTTPEVHFAYDSQKLATVQQATMDAAGVVRATIPNYLLQKAQRINAYVCVQEGETFRTVCKIVIPVHGRAQPSDYVSENEKTDIFVYVDNILGDIAAALDAINGEVV